MMKFVELENNSGLVDVGSNSIVTEWKTSAVHEFGHIYLWQQLGQLQQYRQATAKNLRSATQELRLFKGLTYIVGAHTRLALANGVDVGIAGCGPVDVSSPSLHPACGQTVGVRSTVYEEFCDLVAESARYIVLAFRGASTNCGGSRLLSPSCRKRHAPRFRYSAACPGSAGAGSCIMARARRSRWHRRLRACLPGRVPDRSSPTSTFQTRPQLPFWERAHDSVKHG